MNQSRLPSDIRLFSLLNKPKQTRLNQFITAILDKLMAVDKVRKLYVNSQLPGMEKQAFGETLMAMLDTKLVGKEALHSGLPASGSAVLVCNHPFGCIEGVALATELSKIRPDVKVLANTALKIFTEIRDNFIFINPLVPASSDNAKAIKACKTHLKQGGVLLVFPAGKVSYYREEKQRICDDEWNRLPAHLARVTDSPVLPLFVEGHNSKLFIRLGRIYYRFKLLMLFREMLSRKGQPITMRVGQLLSTKLLSKFKDDQSITDFIRLQSYLLQGEHLNPWPEDKIISPKPLMAGVAPELLAKEVKGLAASQHLADYKQFSVCYGYQSQIPNVVKEITRLREKVFRLYNEGSGEPCDTDKFDATYTHLFIFDNEKSEIIGAYRMGQTDKLIEQSGVEGLYLNKMFEFDAGFLNRSEPCLEMGRSFIVPEHQRSFYGLFLLWRGIGEFVVRHPQYRHLYGTVSLSKLYSPVSVDCINQLALDPAPEVRARSPFETKRNPELSEFLAKHSKMEGVLSLLVRGIEADGKDVPVLMKQYEKMNARFYTIGIDKSFNDTPGLLLSVHLPSAPMKSLKQYLGDGLQGYLEVEQS